MATVVPKGISMTEMRLLSEFSNAVSAREYSQNVTIQKLTLSYDSVTGFSIELVEVPKEQPVE